MKIEIGNSTYNFTKQDIYDEDSEIDNNLGYCDPINALIVIDDKIPKQAKQQTFFHELTHAILDEAGLLELCEDEGKVDVISKMLYGFFKNNDVMKIFKYAGE